MDTGTRGIVRGRSAHSRVPDYREPRVGYIKRELHAPIAKVQAVAPPSPLVVHQHAPSKPVPQASVIEAPKPLPTIPVYVDAPRPSVSPLQKNPTAGSFDMAPRHMHRKATSAHIYSKVSAASSHSPQPTSRSINDHTTSRDDVISGAKIDGMPLQVPGFVYRVPAKPASSSTLTLSSVAEYVDKKLSPAASIFNQVLSWNIKSLVKARKFTRIHALYGMAIAIFIGGVGVSLQGFFVNQQVVDQVHAVAQSDNNSDEEQSQRDVPSEKPLPSDPTEGYRVSALAPRVMSIPKLGVKARVLSLGVSENNEMLTPKNIYDTGWYNGSAQPGDPGATVINGHVSGPTKHGVFHDIKGLSVGDELVLERGDGVKLSYAVKNVETIPEKNVDMVKLMNSAVPGGSGLNLITCGGKYNQATRGYADRTIVYAVLR